MNSSSSDGVTCGIIFKLCLQSYNFKFLKFVDFGNCEIWEFGNLGFVAKYNFENLKLKIWGILEFSIAKGGREGEVWSA